MQIQEYKAPFRHWIITWCGHDSVESSDGIVAKAFAEIPGQEWSGWEARYENDCERHKRTSREVEKLGPAFDHMWTCWNRDVDWLERITGIHGLQSDPSRHGAGLHVTDPGGYLATHLDYAINPVNGLERRLNLVLFLNPHWQEAWGGAFEMCDEMGAVVKRVYPDPHKAVLWEPSDIAFHGTQRVADDAPLRATLAIYYLAPARPGVTRKRAMYFPKRS